VCRRRRLRVGKQSTCGGGSVRRAGAVDGAVLACCTPSRPAGLGPYEPRRIFLVGRQMGFAIRARGWGEMTTGGGGGRDLDCSLRGRTTSQLFLVRFFFSHPAMIIDFHETSRTDTVRFQFILRNSGIISYSLSSLKKN
jgi:hypothetical protein